MADEHPFLRYTREVLAYGFAGEEDTAPPVPAPPDDEQARRNLHRALAAWERSGKGRLCLLGLGCGRLAADLAETPACRAAGPAGPPLIVCEPDPRRVRRAPDVLELARAGRLLLLADTSPWAFLLLLAAQGIDASSCLPMRTPELSPEERQGPALLQRVLASTRRIGPAEPGGESGPTPSLSAAAVLHHDEPGLDDFFGQFPGPEVLQELAVVWDGLAPPAADFACAAPMLHTARPLELDFAAQRNAMLAACSGDWVLYLDGDERLDPGAWAALPALLARLEREGINGLWLPRRTLYPGDAHCKVGYGLWPDLQLRLFRRTAEAHFVRPVHERLTGLPGPTAVAPGLPIDHYSRLRKSARTLAEKLELFDRAGGRSALHRLSEDYPRLPVDFPGITWPGPAADGRATPLLVLAGDPA